MTDAKRIAIVEDDDAMAQSLAHIVANEGHNVTLVTSGDALIKHLKRDTSDLVFLDWNLPGISGIETLDWMCTNLASSPPVIMLTGRNGKADMVSCLAAGADDYIIKPEAPNVIVARMNAVLRRSFPKATDQRYVIYGHYEFDKLGGTVAYNNQIIPMTAKEFALAILFFSNPNRPISRAYILEKVWNSVADLPTRTLDMHVSRIRSKLSLGTESGYRISTIFGYGYRLEAYQEDVQE